ncbi:MAG TPA: hypothetical protein VD837_12995 [Terriglobales bacterium]|nr:hypothetical protein [Terriglobales bacterium]
MLNRCRVRDLGLLLASVLFASVLPLLAQQILFTPVKPETIGERLRSFPPRDPERQVAIEKLFLDVGCVRENVTLQRVPHQNLPNVVCVMPGKTDDQIVVGAHFDHINDGDGVADVPTRCRLPLLP